MPWMDAWEDDGYSRAMRIFPLLLLVIGCGRGPQVELHPPEPPPPIWPVTYGCGSAVPQGACALFQETLAQDPKYFRLASAEQTPDVVLGVTEEGKPLGEWVYALAAPFTTIPDGVTRDELSAAWRGERDKAQGPLLVGSGSATTWAAILGQPGADATREVSPEEWVSTARASNAWMLVPFHKLTPHMKVLAFDGKSPLDKDLDLPSWPLRVPLRVASKRQDALDRLQGDLSNRYVDRMSVVAFTGVTAMTRLTSAVIDRKGPKYIGKDVADLLRSADFTHISNEVSFHPDCPRPHPVKTLRFCSHDSYIELLDYVGADIIELTGNHNNDYGRKWSTYSIDLYEKRGWKWFGGGRNAEDAAKRAEVVLGPNRLSFHGCNPVGGENAWATEDQPGALRCRTREEFHSLVEAVKQARADGWLPLVTMQYWEKYQYHPTKEQKEDFYALAEAGAAFVSGSQAHQAQGFGFPEGSFVHYGPGNFFFDQMGSLGTRQEFVDFLTFYDGRLLNVTLHTFLLEEYARPRPMNMKERRRLLRSTFEVSTW